MGIDDVDYSQEEWAASAGHRPLKDRNAEDLHLLHRHWMWANQIREAFDQALREGPSRDLPPPPLMLASKSIGFMLVWYAMLWAVIEACTDPKERRLVDIRGRFRQDIDVMSPTLRDCRNAIFHVPRNGQILDDRISAFVVETAATTVHRVSRGFGRLFLEELKSRIAAS